MPSPTRWRRVLTPSGRWAFRYVAGDSLAALGITGTRADTTTCARSRDAAGLWQLSAANVARDAHFQKDPATGLFKRTWLREGAATNLLTYGRDLTNAAWTASSVTVAATTGADGVAASGSRLTATGANGTVKRTAALVHGSAAYAGSFVAKRITGTGNIDLTLDNGSTWTTVTLTSAFTQLFKTQTLANSQFGIRLVTSGDVIDVDFCQNETGSVPSSPIGTAAAAVTRAADLWSFAWSRVPEAGTWYVDAYDLTIGASKTMLFVGDVTATAPRWLVYRSTTPYRSYFDMVGANSSISDTAASPAFGDRVEVRPFVTVAGANATTTIGMSVNGAAEAVAAAGAACTLAAAYTAPTRLYIGMNGNGANATNLAIRSIVYVPQADYSLAAFRAITGG